MRKHTNLIVTCVILVTYFLAINSPVILAATPTTAAPNPANNGQALEIAPPVIILTVNPGQTVSTQVYIRDISSGNLIVTGQANDFLASGEDGAPKVILDDTTNNPYSLRSWVASLPTLTLVPREIKSLNVTFHVPADASPGGHYGTIRFTASAPSVTGSGVSLSASIGALVLLTVNGKLNESLSVQEFSVSHNGKTGSSFESGPLNFVERFKNTGNVHVEPIGQVTIIDMFGKKVAAVNVNLPPGNILPQSIRKFSQPLDKTVIGNKKLFGRYRANLKVTYGADKKVLTASMVFWIIPYRLIASLIVVLIVGFFALRYLIKRYNRYILSKSQKPSNKPRQH